jgi:hypothetical protein
MLKLQDERSAAIKECGDTQRSPEVGSSIKMTAGFATWQAQVKWSSKSLRIGKLLLFFNAPSYNVQQQCMMCCSPAQRQWRGACGPPH